MSVWPPPKVTVPGPLMPLSAAIRYVPAPNPCAAVERAGAGDVGGCRSRATGQRNRFLGQGTARPIHLPGYRERAHAHEQTAGDICRRRRDVVGAEVHHSTIEGTQCE